jgi:hypothetical protein
MGRLGAASAIAYACSFVFFTGTVVYALVDGTTGTSSSLVRR